MTVGFTVVMHAPARDTIDQKGVTTTLVFKFIFKLNSYI